MLVGVDVGGGEGEVETDGEQGEVEELPVAPHGGGAENARFGWEWEVVGGRRGVGEGRREMPRAGGETRGVRVMQALGCVMEYHRMSVGHE